jgi:hypothetical protein
MESDNGMGIDKGKYIDMNESENNNEAQSKDLDKGKGKETESVPPFSIWAQVFPGKDPSSVFFPIRTNPGPGFNVPGGEVPLNDEICKHIDYNGHILRQFRTMDLETAIEQKNNYMSIIKVIDTKLAYAQNAFNQVPAIPTTEYEFKLKNQIIKDLNNLSSEKLRAEGKATLINSRIEFIKSKLNNNNN